MHQIILNVLSIAEFLQMKFHQMNPHDFLTQDILPKDSAFVFSNKKHTGYSLIYSPNTNCVFMIIYRFTSSLFIKKCKTALQDTQTDLIVLFPFFSRALGWALLKNSSLPKKNKCFFYKISAGKKIEIFDIKTFQLNNGRIYQTKPSKVDLKTSSKNPHNERIFKNEISYRLLHDEKFRTHAEAKALAPSSPVKVLLKKQTFKTLFSFFYYKLIQKLDG
jgi:hypothetical protein